MKTRTRGNRYLVVAATISAAITFMGQVRAETSVVAGTVSVDDAAKGNEPPERNAGFVARTANPVVPVVPFNPLPWVIVVLEPKSKLAAEHTETPKVPLRYELVGESFKTPVFGVTAKAEVEFKNAGARAYRLYAPSQPDLLEGDPINPGGNRIARVEMAHQPITIRDRDAPHLRGTVVGFPLRYFSLVDSAGNFEIPDVPAGKWKLRVWYRDGWLKRAGSTISVSGKRVTTKVELPAVLETSAPSGAGKSE
jgi:hypothetical protein